MKGRLRAVAGLTAVAAMAFGAAVLLGFSPWRAVRADSAAPASAGAQPAQVTGNVETGRQLFLANCASCHGDVGQGGTSVPRISDKGPALIDFVLRTGRMPLPFIGMPMQRGQAVFNQQQISDIVAYVASLGGGGPDIPDVTTGGADLSLGRQLYIANCAACHGAAGSGDAIGGGYVAPSLHQATPVEVGEAVLGGPIPMPRFNFDAGQLNALAAYVVHLRSAANPGGLTVAEVGPVPEGFVAGFVGLVVLLILVRWIGRRPENPEPPIPDSPGVLAATSGPPGDHDSPGAAGDQHAEGTPS